MAKLTNVKTVDMVKGEITKVAYDGAEYAKVANDFRDAQTGDLFLNTENGGFYEITIRASDFYGVPHPVRFVNDKGRETGYMRECNVHPLFRKISSKPTPTLEERVTDLETEVAALKSNGSSLKGDKVETEPKRLTVGDFAKIIDEESGHSGNIGDVVKIVADDEDDQPYKCTRISDGKDVGWFCESELEVYAEETIEFEGATYRKVDREAREGDVIVLPREQANETTHVTAGKPYKVLREIDFVVDNGDQYDVYFNTLGRTRETVDVYEPIEQAKYVPQEGDVVVIIANNSGSRNAVGDIGKLSDVTSYDAKVNVPAKPDSDEVDGNWHVFDDFRKATPAEAEVYEKAAHKASFSVGDYVKIVKSYVGNEGALLRITGIGDYRTGRGPCEFKLEALTGKTVGEESGATADQIVKATDAEIAKATAPKLKAGDFVKITSGTSSIIEGEIYEVLRDDENELHIIDNDGDSRWFPLALGRAKYEIVDAETAKWAKIGRKVGELRRGDIIRIKNHCGASGFSNGQITEVTEDSSTDHARVGSGWLVSAELIAPVESTVA